MKNKTNIIIYVILFGVILYLSAQNQKTLPPEIITKTDTTFRIRINYTPPPFIVFRDTGTHSVSVIHDTTPIPTDTNAILADYKQKRIYKDTLLNDSTGFVLVVDTVQFNRVMSRASDIRVYSKTTTITRHPTWHIYAGAGIGGNLNMFDISPLAAFQSKRQTLYFVQYGVFSKSIQIGIAFQLK